MSKARTAVNEFDEARRELLEFLDDNPAYTEPLLSLADEYNRKLDTARDTLRSVSTPSKINVGSFTRSKDPSGSTQYDPAKLPESVLAMPGVVKVVNASVVSQLVLAGKVQADEVKDAEYVSEPRAASVSSPKPVTLQL